MRKINRRQFVAAATAAATVFTSKHALAFQGGTRNQSAEASNSLNRERVQVEADPFSMKNVRLTPGPFSAAAEANRGYLKTLPPARRLHTFRLTAGLPSSAEPLGDWEKPDCELRGHFVGGHYLSACAMSFASSGDEELSTTAISWLRSLRNVRRNTKTVISARFLRNILTVCAME